ncbi:hypothetical protein ASG35_27290 [Burkholderia sp. Leaf177]|uniref:DUF7024 domain-containing protein n=1 Tax=Burkholderia sp. Leaf177 TaxID=1736287 RepID=UPI0006F6D53E|nr:hypothetical protein ASG35_27290 [Burkholderia sp. Leaf177]
MKSFRQIPYYFLLTLACGVSVYFFFQGQFNSHFAFLYGDEFDGLIETFLVSHWFDAFKLRQSWTQPIYFFPHAGVLGYNDSYFLYGVVASLFRLVGFNMFVSQELCHAAIKAIGFFSMAALLNALVSRKLFSILGAVLFTLALNSSVQAGHGQLLSVALSPLLSFLLVKGAEAFRIQRIERAFAYACGFIILFNALLLTSFYMAWFYGLFCLLYIFSFVLVDRKASKLIVCDLWVHKKRILLLAIVFIVTVAPFLYVYLPKLKQTGGQGYRSQLIFSLRFADLVNFGDTSAIWGWLSTLLSKSNPAAWRMGEFQMGFTPDILVLFLAAIAAAWIAKRRSYITAHRALIVATVIGLLLPISVNGHSLWFFVRLIPGASGMRVISRFYIFLAFPLALLISLFLSRLSERSRVIGAVTTVVFVFVCAGQINQHPALFLDANKHAALIDNANAPPAECQSFFAVNPTPRSTSMVDFLYRQNVQAMLIAAHFNLPTLNGFASFNPPDWIFEQNPEYMVNVLTYIRKHDLKNVCSYDISANSWSRDGNIDFAKGLPVLPLGSTFNFSTDRTIQFYSSGWSATEPWGVWSNAKVATLGAHLAVSPINGLILRFGSKAFLVPAHPELTVTVRVNGTPLATYEYRYPDDGQEHMRTLKVPADIAARNGTLLQIQFDVANPTSPEALQINGDDRLLGIGLTSLQVN